MSEHSDLSQRISELANNYDQEQLANSDANQIRSLVQGMMVGTAIGPMSSVLKVVDVEQEKDRNGDYEHFFIIETESGIRLRVSVDVEP